MAYSKTDFSSNSLVYEMASLLNICGLCLWLYLASRSSKQVLSQNPIHGTVYIDGSASIATTDEDFICATLDWWPPDKCDYGTCSWGTASLLNLVSRSTSLSLSISLLLCLDSHLLLLLLLLFSCLMVLEYVCLTCFFLPFCTLIRKLPHQFLVFLLLKERGKEEKYKYISNI